MNFEKLHKKLIQVERAKPVSESVPFAFEKRIMANLLAQAKVDQWSTWGLTLWRAAAPYVVLMLLLGVWSMTIEGKGADSVKPLSEAFEYTLYQPINASIESW